MSTKSSELSSGDVIAMSADILKLLSPVFKGTSKEKFEGLKSKSKIVQSVFRDLLDSTEIQCFRPTIPYVNNTKIKFNPKVSFFVFTIPDEASSGEKMQIAIGAEISGKKVPIAWHHIFEPLKETISSTNFVGFVSLKELVTYSVYDGLSLDRWIQDRLMAHGCSLTFETLIPGEYHVTIVRGNYLADELIRFPAEIIF